MSFFLADLFGRLCGSHCRYVFLVVAWGGAFMSMLLRTVDLNCTLGCGIFELDTKVEECCVCRCLAAARRNNHQEKQESYSGMNIKGASTPSSPRNEIFKERRVKTLTSCANRIVFLW